jgi:regulation of enolase protein 1 (concanavalin A-like superfamily)
MHMKILSNSLFPAPWRKRGVGAPTLVLGCLIAGGFCASAWAGLPAGWTDADIGSPAHAGSAGDTNGGWTVTGGGADIWGSADQFNFASESVTGDGTIIAEVLTVQNADPGSGWSKAGIMFRNDSTAGAINAAVVATVGQGVSFQWRATANGVSDYANHPGLTAPIWVKLARSGTTFSAYYSADGNSWTQVGTSQSLSLNSSCLAGLAVTAHNNSATNTSTFTNVSVAVSVPVITLPVITNLPAVNIHATLATLPGQVLNNGNQSPAVTVFYGPANGGVNAAAWSNSVALGPQSGYYAVSVTSLATNTTYYFASSGMFWEFFIERDKGPILRSGRRYRS